MDYDVGRSSNNLDEPSSNTANLPEGGLEEGRATRWRSLTIIYTAIFLVILLAGAVYLGLAYREPTAKMHMARPTSSPTRTPTPVTELPPPYPRLQWSSPEQGEFLFPLPSPPYAIELEGYYIQSVVTQVYPNDFLNYYQRELSARDWQQTDAAGGPDGEWYNYQKASRHFSIGVKQVSEEKYQAVVQYSK